MLLYDVDDGYSLLIMHIMLPEIRRSGYTISGCIRFYYIQIGGHDERSSKMAVKLIDELQKEIKAAGEAVKQEAYEKAYDHVFQILDNLEKLLNDNRYLEGNEITEEDKRLYDILIRFDAVYYFKQRLNRKALRDYDNLWNYAKELYSIPEYKEFADFEKIKQEELLGTKEENPYQIVGLGPDESYWNEPNNRAEKFA